MRRITLSALALVGSLGVSGIVRADCCNDFWSCAAMVATGGLSCQIQSIIDTVNSMKTLVETMANTLRNQANNIMSQAQTAVGDAATDLKKLREQAITDLQKATEKAHEIANPPKDKAMAPALIGAVKNDIAMKPVGPAAASPAAAAAGPTLKGGGMTANVGANAPMAPKQADAQAIADALQRAENLVKDFRSKANTAASQIQTAEQAALSAATRHLVTAQRISLDLAITPLNTLRDSLLDLLAHPERIFDPSAQINADIQRITAQVPAMMDRITNEIMQEAVADLHGVTNTMQQLQDSASAGDHIVDAMQKVASSRLQSDLDALERLAPKPAAPPPPPPGNAVGGQALASAAVISGPALFIPSAAIAKNRQAFTFAINRADATKLPLVVQQRAAVTDLGAKWQSIQALKTPVQIQPATVQKVDKDLGDMFTGKSKTDALKKKNELLDEAGRRFAKDPKTLEKVKQYIETHAPKG
jgi:hypothetical protein